MEVKIGVQNAARELVVECTESSDELLDRLEKAVSSDGTFSITDSRGRRVVVPARVIAYVEIGGGVSGQVGFRG
jgi:hypothetical protein